MINPNQINKFKQNEKNKIIGVSIHYYPVDVVCEVWQTACYFFFHLQVVGCGGWCPVWRSVLTRLLKIITAAQYQNLLQ